MDGWVRLDPSTHSLRNMAYQENHKEKGWARSVRSNVLGKAGFLSYAGYKHNFACSFSWNLSMRIYISQLILSYLALLYRNSVYIAWKTKTNNFSISLLNTLISGPTLSPSLPFSFPSHFVSLTHSMQGAIWGIGVQARPDLHAAEQMPTRGIAIWMVINMAISAISVFKTQLSASCKAILCFRCGII